MSTTETNNIFEEFYEPSYILTHLIYTPYKHHTFYESLQNMFRIHPEPVISHNLYIEGDLLHTYKFHKIISFTQTQIHLGTKYEIFTDELGTKSPTLVAHVYDDKIEMIINLIHYQKKYKTIFYEMGMNSYKKFDIVFTGTFTVNNTKKYLSKAYEDYITIHDTYIKQNS